jgi:GNAT superfamily N-acetyltransferase
MIIPPPQELRIVPLDKRCDLSSFSSSNEDLNDFLKSDAIKSQEDLISRTYLCLWHERVAGFFTLVTDTIEVKLIEQDDSIDGYTYQKYPAIKIARMAVDEKFSGAGVGRYLLLSAVGKVHHISQEVGCRYITVDSKREAIGFYEKNGFKLIKKYEKRKFPPMYLNMYPIIQKIAQMQ